MINGNIQRKISNGLVEMSWYLPSGNENADIFKEPLAVANLRGDIASFETQFSFLCETSTAVFLFCDDLDTHKGFLKPLHFRSNLFLVCSLQSSTSDTNDLQQILTLMKSNTSLLIKHKNMNDADFVRKLQQAVAEAITHSPKTCIEAMSKITPDLGINVDEFNLHCRNAKERADAITKSITDISSYKSKELTLQGTLWRDVSKFEKEECRLKHAGNKNIEHYRSEVQTQIQEFRSQQGRSKLTQTNLIFNSGLFSPLEERRYFLKWMKINLESLTRKTLSNLKEVYKKQCQNPTKDQERIAHLEQQIASSSLGIEHFFREIGQFYESSSYREQLKNLPNVCAQLMLDGFPIELVDGDVSNIPLKWVGDIIKELDLLTKPNNKIRVVTVLGVQSTGKSTLLNTMFGIQFAVSSGRCTRGAFMLLIPVAEEFKNEVKCDFIMVIDTEGLKSPELAKLANSYEHDNELATLVVGLSDLTVVNIAMENATEMKDTLQIVVHAFLRMKEIGKRPCCHFVHQNVSDIAASDNTLRDRKLLFEQLNEMTQAAGRMENRGNNKTFSDLLEYDPDKNNWYIPGLWQGTPPMSPVSTGYSDEVYKFKQGILEYFKTAKPAAYTFLQFEEWVGSLWRAVKYENFIFSFRNSLVAEAYSKLCSEFHTWEWEFKKKVNAWFMQSETKIFNFCNSTVESSESVDDLLQNLKYEAADKIAMEAEILQDKIKQYFEREEDHVSLVEMHKEDFLISAVSLKNETEINIKNKLYSVVVIQKSRTKLEEIRQKQKNMMKQRVLQLIEVCRSKKGNLTKNELEKDFQTMWDETVKDSCFNAMPRQNVAKDIYNLLRNNLVMKGGAVHEMLSNIKCLEECGKEPFVTIPQKKTCLDFFGIYARREQTMRIHEASLKIIHHSKRFIEEKTSAQSDYNSIDAEELLGCIDENVETVSKLQMSAEQIASLKIYICGHAAREFQQMHDAFIDKNDPRKTLESFRLQWLNDFEALYYQTDQCKIKAERFANQCLEPAVMEYIQKSLGPDIVEEMLTSKQGIAFSTRSFFQFSFLKELLLGNDFSKIVQYIESYEEFVTMWISEQITKHFSTENRLAKLETNHLNKAISKINEDLANALIEFENTCKNGQGSINTFVIHFCTNLRKELVIPADSLDATLFLNSSNINDFAECLKSSIEELQKTITSRILKESNVRQKLSRMSMPKEELFSRVFGCGKSCPFCKAPCEAGGKNHTEHFASIHRPEGTGNYRWVDTEKLVPDICSSLVASQLNFRCVDTGFQWHPYSDYRTVYPDWRIQPDTSIQASDFWKYIFAKYNKQFARKYNALPADIPTNWYNITLQQAQSSLEEIYMVKLQKKRGFYV